MLSKRQLRKHMQERLSALLPDQVQDYSAQLRARLTPHWQRPLHVCLYAPLPHEVNLLPLLRERPENAYYFPRCLPERQMSFHRVTDPMHDLQPGAMGILEPLANLPTLRPQDAQLIIVPGLAFTPTGKRLGYGGGYYDRFLPLCPQALTLAVVFPQQVLHDLPTDAHDIPLQQVIILTDTSRNTALNASA